MVHFMESCQARGGAPRLRGARLGPVVYECVVGWAAAAGDPTTCERTVTRAPEWECPANHTLDTATSPPHCHPDSTTGPTDPTDPVVPVEAGRSSSLGALGSGTTSRSGSWAVGCESSQKRTDQVPYYAYSYTFAVTGTATADIDVASTGDPHVYVLDADGTVEGSDDDSGPDGHRDLGLGRHDSRSADQPAELRVENGNSIVRTWAYEPGAATVAIASAFPDGITAAVSRYTGTTTSEVGRATLTATPSKVGQFAALVTYANGTATLTKATTINSYCPDGQTELPSDCGTPLAKLFQRRQTVLIFPPEGFAPAGFQQSNRCLDTRVGESTSRYLCRQPVMEARVYISKSDPRILAVSEPYVDNGGDHGRTLMLRSTGVYLDGLEGCQSITADTWQCDYSASRYWATELEEASFGDLAGPAIRKFALGQLSATVDIAVCAAALVALAASVTAVGGFNPQAGAAVFIRCPGALPSES